MGNREIPDLDMLFELADLFKVFGDSTRLRIMYAISDEELSSASRKLSEWSRALSRISSAFCATTSSFARAARVSRYTTPSTTTMLRKS